MSNKSTTVTLILEDKLTQEILKDTIADSRKSEQFTVRTIFDIGLALVAGKIAERCPRLHNNLSKWGENDGDDNGKE